ISKAPSKSTRAPRKNPVAAALLPSLLLLTPERRQQKPFNVFETEYLPNRRGHPSPRRFVFHPLFLPRNYRVAPASYRYSSLYINYLDNLIRIFTILGI